VGRAPGDDGKGKISAADRSGKGFDFRRGPPFHKRVTRNAAKKDRRGTAEKGDGAKAVRERWK